MSCEPWRSARASSACKARSNPAAVESFGERIDTRELLEAMDGVDERASGPAALERADERRAERAHSVATEQHRVGAAANGSRDEVVALRVGDEQEGNHEVAIVQRVERRFHLLARGARVDDEHVELARGQDVPRVVGRGDELNFDSLADGLADRLRPDAVADDQRGLRTATVAGVHGGLDVRFDFARERAKVADVVRLHDVPRNAALQRGAAIFFGIRGGHDGRRSGRRIAGTAALLSGTRARSCAACSGRGTRCPAAAPPLCLPRGARRELPRRRVPPRACTASSRL